jgi:glycosyltransferase involved in cell wall biosynthesis
MLAKLISIIIPAYNAEKYIARCLESVSAQTYDNIEIIVINDGSTDKTLGLISRYAQKDGRIKIIDQKNKGLSGARNAGFDTSRGEYIFFLDADDFIGESAIEKLYCFAEEHALEMAEGKIVYYYDTGTVSDYSIGCNRNVILSGSDEIFSYYLGSFKKVNAWNKLIKRSYLLENNIRFIEGLISEDVPWLYLDILSTVKRAGFTNDITYYYYKNNNNSITRSYSIRHFESYLFIVRQLINNKLVGDWLIKTSNDISNDYLFYAIKQLGMLDMGNDIRTELLKEIKNIISDKRYGRFLHTRTRFTAKTAIYMFKYFGTRVNLFVLSLVKCFLSLRYKKKIG